MRRRLRPLATKSERKTTGGEGDRTHTNPRDGREDQIEHKQADCISHAAEGRRRHASKQRGGDPKAYAPVATAPVRLQRADCRAKRTDKGSGCPSARGDPFEHLSTNHARSAIAHSTRAERKPQATSTGISRASAPRWMQRHHPMTVPRGFSGGAGRTNEPGIALAARRPCGCVDRPLIETEPG